MEMKRDVLPILAPTRIVQRDEGEGQIPELITETA